MRVLVVDQDSASNLAITRSLRELYTVDCVTNKGDCLDLLRANTYEVIVATERLEDGSGLELLGTISKKWPSVLRIFAAERQRLQLLRGRLGPFELFQTLTYPVDSEKLIATLAMAAAAHHGQAEQIELADAGPGKAPEQDPDDPHELERSDEFEEPRFARAGRAARAEPASSVSRRSSDRGTPASGRPSVSAQRARSGSAGVAASDAPRGQRARRNTEPNQGNELAARFPGSGTIGPRRGAARSGSPGGLSTGPARSARPRVGGDKAFPVKFPPLERAPLIERVPPLEPPSGRNRGGAFSEAAAIARAARSNYESGSVGPDMKRLATLIGGGVAVVAIVVLLAFKMVGSKSDPPKAPAPVVAHAPAYPPEVATLIARIEADFKADDFKTARLDVDQLRRLAPSHPRLDFFDGLVIAKGNGAASGRGTAKKNVKSGSSIGATSSASAPSAAGAAASTSTAASTSAHLDPDPRTVTAADAQLAEPTSAGAVPAGRALDARSATGLASTGSLVTSNSADTSPGLAPETPVGFTRSPDATPSPPAAGTSGAGAAAPAADALPPSAAAGAGTAASTSASESAHEAVATPTRASPASRSGGGEPPPVIREAKLVRRVNPDYPSAAKRDSISGFVDLELTISTQGNVDDVTVTQSTPSGLFDKSAVAAVRKWKYDPRFIDGLPAVAHLKVHLEFSPNG